MNIEMMFISEQDGDVERELKHVLSKVFLSYSKPVRAYLALAQLNPNTASEVVLCLWTQNGHDHSLLNQCAQVFKSMFAPDQQLDILFLSDKQERALRQLCCPFYTSVDFNVSTPDFYLFSSEGYHLNDMARACYMRKRLYGDHLDGYMLCDISPAIIGQPFDLGNKDIQQVILANRLEGTTLFPVSNWPMPVYVTRALHDDVEWKEALGAPDVELIAWAELYKRKDDIK